MCPSRHHHLAIHSAGGPRPEILAVHHQVRRHLPAKAEAKEAAKEVECPRLVRHHRTGKTPWITKAAAMIGFPQRSATMGEEATANAAHGDEAEITEADTSVRALLDQRHRIEQHNAMASRPRPWISGRDQKARVPSQLGEDLPAQPLDRRTPRHRGLGRGRPIGREAQVRRAIAEEQGQRQMMPPP